MLEIFITATDTDAGKTYVAQALVAACVAAQKKVAVYKPISAGCQLIDEQLINEDAQLLMTQANCQQTLSEINPIAFQQAIAPHIAAHQQGKAIELDEIIRRYPKNTSLDFDLLITEGAGGWRLPLGGGKFLSEFVQATKQQVVLVVNMKLGCLNHAVLTYEAIIADGLECIAWVANCAEPMEFLAKNINELSALLPVPLLAQLPHQTDIKIASKEFDLRLLF